MRAIIVLIFLHAYLFCGDFVKKFSLFENDIALERVANPARRMEKVGRRFAVLGYEDGRFEAWAYPLKILRDFKISFFLENSTRPIEAKDIVRRVKITPEANVLTYVFQSTKFI